MSREKTMQAIKKAKEIYLLGDLIIFETSLGTVFLAIRGETVNGTKMVYVQKPDEKFFYTTVDYFLIKYSSLDERILNWIRERK